MGKKKLLVEGINDAIVVGTLCKSHGIWVKGERHTDKEKPADVPFLFRSKDKGSITQLLDELDAELDESDLETLGIVVDADIDLKARWQSLSDRLQECGYPSLSQTPDLGGTIIRAEDKVTIGIWVMPDNRLQGMLEDFVAQLIPPDDALWPYAQQCVAGIESNDRPFKSAHLSKACIHTWLAWRKKPGTPLGSAIKFCYLDANAPQAESFIFWIQRLFAEG